MWPFIDGEKTYFWAMWWASGLKLKLRLKGVQTMTLMNGHVLMSEAPKDSKTIFCDNLSVAISIIHAEDEDHSPASQCLSLSEPQKIARSYLKQDVQGWKTEQTTTWRTFLMGLSQNAPEITVFLLCYSIPWCSLLGSFPWDGNKVTYRILALEPWCSWGISGY